MRRGRWVAYCLALFLITSHYSLVTPCYGITLNMTATVPLSPLWKAAMQINSEVKIDSSHRHILLITQQSLGVEKLPVDKQTIQLLVFKNGQVVAEQEKITNRKGVADFVFVAKETGSYMVIVVNKTDTAPFIVSNELVSL